MWCVQAPTGVRPDRGCGALAQAQPLALGRPCPVPLVFGPSAVGWGHGHTDWDALVASLSSYRDVSVSHGLIQFKDVYPTAIECQAPGVRMPGWESHRGHPLSSQPVRKGN